MKKLNYLFLSGLMALCMLSFSSCSDDDDDFIDLLTNGEWQMTDRAFDLECSPAEVVEPLQKYLKDGIEDTQFSIKFEQNRFIWKEYEGDKVKEEMNGTYTIQDGKLTLKPLVKAPLGIIGAPEVKDEIVFDNILLDNGQLILTRDIKTFVQELSKLDGFWEELGIEKPEGEFKISKLDVKYTLRIIKR